MGQSNNCAGLRVLPIIVMACDKMAVLCGPLYARRLWCVWELCVLASFMPVEQAAERVQLSEVGQGGGLELLCDFEVGQAHCSDPNEEARLRMVIGEFGKSEFEGRVRRMARILAAGLGRPPPPRRPTDGGF